MKENFSSPSYLDIYIKALDKFSYPTYHLDKLLKSRTESSQSTIFSLVKCVYIKNDSNEDITNLYLKLSFSNCNISCSPIPVSCIQKGKTDRKSVV